LRLKGPEGGSKKMRYMRKRDGELMERIGDEREI